MAVVNPAGIHRAGGYALVLVLWVIGLLSLVAATAYNGARTEARLAAAENARLEGEAAAEAGLWLALNTMVAGGPENRSRYTEHSETERFAGHDVHVSVRDLAGRINVNTANAALLAAVIAPHANEEEDATAVVRNIVDWIDADNVGAGNGNESQPYRAAGLDHTPNNRPFVTVDELRLVAGMTDRLYREIAPYLTVLGEHLQVNSISAEPELVRLISEGEFAGGSGSQRYLTTLGSNAYVLTSEVVVNDIAATVSAVVELTGRRTAGGYRILAWQSADVLVGSG